MNEQHSSSPDLYIAAMLLAIGLVAMTSASVEVSANLHGDALYYFKHQSLLMAVGVLGALVLARIPLSVHRKLAPWYGVFSLALLTLALIPGLGHTVNNSTRWLDLGPVRFQPSELIKPRWSYGWRRMWRSTGRCLRPACGASCCRSASWP